MYISVSIKSITQKTKLMKTKTMTSVSMISICISILVPLPPHDRKYFSIKTANTCIFSTVNRKQKFLSAVSHTQNLDLAVNRKPYTWPHSTKKQKRNKSKFVTKFVIIISVASVIIRCYSGKNISQTANKNFAKHTVFWMTTWITKTKIKQLVERPQQILINYGYIS